MIAFSILGSAIAGVANVISTLKTSLIRKPMKLCSTDAFALPGSARDCPKDVEYTSFLFKSDSTLHNASTEKIAYLDSFYNLLKVPDESMISKNVHGFVLNSEAVSMTPGIDGINNPLRSILFLPTRTLPKITVIPDIVLSNTTESPGIIETIFLVCEKDCSMYLELCGGRGGNVLFFDSLGNTLGYYKGGLPGVVYGYLEMRKGQVLKIHIGRSGTDLDTSKFFVNSIYEGGIASRLGGANGGSASHATLYDSYKEAIGDVNGTLVAVAGGGGGAGKNASGGNAGFATGPESKNPNGQQGSLLYSLENTGKYNIQFNEFSGGGGSQSRGGRSVDSDSDGTFYKNNHTGGASYNSFSSVGGGGGGGGFYGGAAGASNNLTKPNNLHGAGGGGSSFTGLLQFPRQTNFNFYNSTQGYALVTV